MNTRTKTSTPAQYPWEGPGAVVHSAYDPASAWIRELSEDIGQAVRGEARFTPQLVLARSWCFDAGLLDDGSERLAFLARIVGKGLSGEAGVFDREGLEPLAHGLLVADSVQLSGQLVEDAFRHAARRNPAEPGEHLE